MLATNNVTTETQIGDCELALLEQVEQQFYSEQFSNEDYFTLGKTPVDTDTLPF